MMRLAFAAVVGFFLFFQGLTLSGLLGPDEPRYAAIGLEMARSGDWITPRLWGERWFEKPALLYWMTALASRLGFGPDLAPRVPVAVLSAGFLLFYYRWVKRVYAERVAMFATGMLATCAGWLGYSYAAVTDLPLTATFSAGMFFSLDWLLTSDRKRLRWAGVAFGLAILAKGLVPVALVLPLLWFGRREGKALLVPAAIAAAVAAVWYIPCTIVNGWPFVEEFFLKHHLSRFTNNALQHKQPVWYYLPVLVGLLMPWTPMAAAAARLNFRGVDRRFLLSWFLFGLAFFSMATNKLPGYLLPLLPAAALLFGMALEEVSWSRWCLGVSVLGWALAPTVAATLPGALEAGLSRAGVSWQISPLWLTVGALAIAIYTVRHASRAFYAALMLAAGSVVYLKVTALPVLDASYSARGYWRERGGQIECLDEVHRSLRYGLNYYAGQPIPECSAPPREPDLRRTP